MIIYIDSDFHCHAENAQGLRGFEDAFFDGKCKTLIECYRYVPDGETWTRDDGVEFSGTMAAPWKDITNALEVQEQYQADQQELDSILTQIEQALGGSGT